MPAAHERQYASGLILRLSTHPTLGPFLPIPERLTALDQTPATAIKPSHYLAINHLLARIKPRFVSEIYFGIVDDRVLSLIF